MLQFIEWVLTRKRCRSSEGQLQEDAGEDVKKMKGEIKCGMG